MWKIFKSIKDIISSGGGASEGHGDKSVKAPDVFEPYRVRCLYEPVKDRKRVVHAIANFMTGGSSRLVVDIIERLGHIYEHEVVTSHNPKPPCYTGLIIHEYRHLGSPDPVSDYFSKFRPELVHIHYWGDCDRAWYENIIKAAERYGCKIIENVNTPVEPYFSDSIDRYVYVSDYVLNAFGRVDGKSLTIYPGSDFNIFTKVDIQDVPDDCIGMVYRLECDKLNEKAIDVFIKVVKRRPSTKVLIVGGGTYMKVYKEAVNNAGVMDSFEFTGYVSYERLHVLYGMMSIFVAPVWKESFGQVSPFAMNMGIPVVGYDVGALSEIIGARDLLAPQGDSERLAEIIIGLLEDRKKRLSIGMANMERARALFSVEVMIKSYAELYEDLLKGT
ncbi:MAG: glycosyltransferase family 4 protein [Deltaproteobacteria bacterium]|nr:glycosyltransferase family 4 protein [Deltaproteobacteria bacterium]